MKQPFKPLNANRADKLKKKGTAKEGASPKLQELLESLQRTADKKKEVQQNE